MFVNAILHHEVPVFDEKPAKFFLGHCRDSFRRVVCVAVACDSTGIKSRLMSDLHRPDDTSVNAPSNPPNPPTPAPVTAPVAAKNDAMFTSKPPEGGGIPVMAWGVAGLAGLVVIVVLGQGGRHKATPPPTIQPLATHAANLPVSPPAISESTPLSGGHSPCIAGHTH